MKFKEICIKICFEVIAMRILLVEDEEALAEALAYILKKHNYAVDMAYDGKTGQELAETGIYDVIILDRMLPGKEGVAILKDIRKLGIKTPVLFLTAKDTIADRVEGLDAGADDYLVKPFASDELLARVRALGRRQEKQLQSDNIVINEVIFDPLRCEANYRSNKVKLTLKEAQLMELMMRNYGQVITKEQILNRVWGYDSDVEINNVDTYIHFLRKKIDPLKSPLIIETVRGIGYCLNGGG